MARLIELKVGNDSILVEVDDGAGPQQYSSLSPVEKVSGSMDESLRVLAAVGKAIKTALKDIGASQAEATLAIKFSGKGKIVIAEASAEASMTVKLTFPA